MVKLLQNNAGGLLGPVFGIPESFQILLMISPILIVKPKNTKSSLWWLIGFQPRATSKVTFQKNFYLSLSLSESLFQLSVLPRTLHVAEYFLLYSLIPSICPGVLRGELHSCWNKHLKLYPRSKSMTVSTTVLTIILRTHHCILSW